VNKCAIKCAIEYDASFIEAVDFSLDLILLLRCKEWLLSQLPVSHHAALTDAVKHVFYAIMSEQVQDDA
jgi:hypothetical protein